MTADRRGQAGRPRDDQLDEAIQEATLSLLAEVGYARITMTEVARRASTVPPTIYRRHPTLRHLVLAVLHREFAGITMAIADQGSLRADLVAYVRTVAATATPQRAAIVAGLLLPMRQDPELASTLRQELQAVSSWGAVVARAIERGELTPAATALTAVGLAALAMVFHRDMLLNLPVDDAFVAELVDVVLLPALPATPAQAAFPEVDHG